MSDADSDLAVLNRAHQLFATVTLTEPRETWDAMPTGYGGQAQPEIGPQTGVVLKRYGLVAAANSHAMEATAQTDAAAAGVIAAARDDHTRAREQTGWVIDEARADAARTAAAPDSPLARREAVRRRAARLHAQHGHVLTARQRALQHAIRLRGLRYPERRRVPTRAAGSGRPGFAPADGRAGVAVRAALSRLGRPYVWGASGPDKFDCSGLTQWSYAQAGVHLHRTTYQQIHDGIPVPRWQIRPGDLVFPSVGHVQLAIGNNLVVEAPHAGAPVRISPLGSPVAIRRPQ